MVVRCHTMLTFSPMKVAELVSFIDQLAPFAYQESYDNAGLLVGDVNEEVSGVLVSLDMTEAVVQEAIDSGCNVVIAHHPIIFKGLKRLTGVNYVERTVILAVQNKIALIATHTNLDNARFGVNQIISDKLGLKNTRILVPKENTLLKLQVYVPAEHASRLRTALAEAGAGSIGDYSACSFSSQGTGRFFPQEGAQPFIGSLNKLEEVSEEKVEVVFQQHRYKAIMNAMYAHHPYEEIAHDVIALENRDAYIGSGMIGELEEAMPVMDFLKMVKETFGCGAVRYTEPHVKIVERIAVCGGSGSFLLRNAIGAKADVFLTADFKYHEFFDAENRIIIADIGHFESEQYTSQWLIAQLKKKFTTFAVRLTNVVTNPINYL